jgi:hypothetical protein
MCATFSQKHLDSYGLFSWPSFSGLNFVALTSLAHQAKAAPKKTAAKAPKEKKEEPKAEEPEAAAPKAEKPAKKAAAPKKSAAKKVTTDQHAHSWSFVLHFADVCIFVQDADSNSHHVLSAQGCPQGQDCQEEPRQEGQEGLRRELTSNAALSDGGYPSTPPTGVVNTKFFGRAGAQ